MSKVLQYGDVSLLKSVRSLMVYMTTVKTETLMSGNFDEFGKSVKSPNFNLSK